jgi:hypothetical protein
MRKTLFALAASALMAGVAFVGCGDDSATTGDMAKSTDGPAGPQDMATTGAKSGCVGFLSCLNDCFTANPNATLMSCETTCAKTAKTTAPTEYNNALDCGQQHCLGNVDAMTGKCLLSADGTRLINKDGTMIDNMNDPTDGSNPNKDCGRCLNDALARLFGNTCDLMSSPDCNPTECKTVTDTCLNDTP